MCRALRTLTLSFLPVCAGGPVSRAHSSGRSELGQRSGQVVDAAGGGEARGRGGRRDDGGAHHRGLRLEAAGQRVRRHGVDQQRPDVIGLRRERSREGGREARVRRQVLTRRRTRSWTLCKKRRVGCAHTQLTAHTLVFASLFQVQLP